MVMAVRDLDGSVYLVCGAYGCIDNDERDLVLAENVPLWKLHRKKVYIACEGHSTAVDLLRYDKKLFDKEITPQSLLSHTVPRMKETIDQLDLISEKGTWGNEMMIILDDRIFAVDSFFVVQEIDEWEVRQDMYLGEQEYIRGALEYMEGLPAKTRILECVKMIEHATHLNEFPLTVVNTRTNKKEIWWSHEDGLKKINRI